MIQRLSFLSCLLMFLFTIPSFTQTANQLTLEDYQRARDFQKNIRKKVYHLSVRPVWLPDSSGLAYLSNGQDGKQFLQIDFTELKRQPLFDHQQVASSLSDLLKKEIKSNELPFSRINFKNAHTISFSIENQNFDFDFKAYKLTKNQQRDRRNRLESKSPDGKWIAFSKDYNLYVRSVETGEEIQLSKDGQKLYEYASYFGWADIIKGENGDRPQQFRVSWSPDSKKILTEICDLRQAEKMYLLDWSREKFYRPQLLSYYRGSPGDSTVIYQQLVIFDLETHKEIKPDLPPAPHFNTINLRWGTDSKKLYGRSMSRGYKELFLLEVNPITGIVDTLYQESSLTNIDFSNFHVHRLENEEKMFLTSEHSGWNQLYELNVKNEELKALTNGQFVINDLVYVDEVQKVVYFTATGREKGRNPYFNHLYRINFDGSELKLLTPENAHHEISMSPDARFFVDNYSTVQKPTVSVLRNTKDGATLMPISKTDAKELLATGWPFPEVFETIGKDGKTTIYGAIWKPTHFDPTKKYPIIDASYTGPHTNVFPRNFPLALNGRSQALAELGFIVMRVDGLGSASRSKAFRDWSYGQLGENLEDHVRAIRYLGKQHSWVDTSRVGIFGHSAGGYDAAHALLRYPDFYKVGVASSADHDHRMEKAWWPEMYMGWPVGEQYHEQSNITMAGNLKGKLLMTHGGIDENVNPSATFKLAEAFIKAGKEFDMLILPSQRHGYRGTHSDYFMMKKWNYFVKHLLDVPALWVWEEE